MGGCVGWGQCAPLNPPLGLKHTQNDVMSLEFLCVLWLVECSIKNNHKRINTTKTCIFITYIKKKKCGRHRI